MNRTFLKETNMHMGLGVVCVTLAGLLVMSGCNSSTAPQTVATTESHDHAHDAEHKADGDSPATTDHHDHSGWWCNEHGVPEEVCGLCSSKLAAEFQKNGDWCADHNRPDSQCFTCHPELEAKFAAKYVAKYGKEPPKPEG